MMWVSCLFIIGVMIGVVFEMRNSSESMWESLIFLNWLWVIVR